MRATGSVGWRWRNAPSSSIPIIPDGTGTPTSATRTASGDYRGALEVALKINCRATGACTRRSAAAYGQLGEREAAGKALRELLEMRPDFAASARRNSRSGAAPRARRAPD